MTLLVVLSAAGSAAEPLTLRGAEPLKDPHRHGSTYDGSVRMAGVVGLPPVVLGIEFVKRQPAAPPPSAPKPEGLRAAPVPLADRPLSLEELEALVEFFPRARPEQSSGGFTAAFAAVKNTVLNHQDRAFTLEMLSRLQTSETGRRVLRELNREATLRGLKISIQPKEYEGTQIVKQNGRESLWGIRGTAHYDSWQYNYNEGFMRMEDRNKALEVAASNMGHELNHLVWRLKSDRLIPGYKAVLARDLGNEKAARLIGYLVSTEINDGTATDYTEETKGLAADPERYWDSMKLWHPGYALALDHRERKDPIAAYEKRLVALAAKKTRYERQRDQWQPAREAELAHFEGPAHGMKDALSEIRSYLEGSEKRYPVNIRQMDEAIRRVSRMKDYLEAGKTEPEKNTKAAALLNATIRSATDPDYLSFEAQMHEDQKALVALVKEKDLPEVQPDPAKIGWQEFYRLVAEDRKDNPDHWSGKAP